MPIYDLKCRACGAIERDVLMSMKDLASDRECAQCKAKGTMEKAPCRTHVKFFGGGWATVAPQEKKETEPRESGSGSDNPKEGS